MKSETISNQVSHITESNPTTKLLTTVRLSEITWELLWRITESIPEWSLAIPISLAALRGYANSSMRDQTLPQNNSHKSALRKALQDYPSYIGIQIFNSRGGKAKVNPEIPYSYQFTTRMDPLSLTASLLAIGTAATTALQISKSLYDLARAYKSAAEEIEYFALDLRSFASVVQLGQESVDRHRKRAPLSEVIKFIESLDIVNQLSMQSKRTALNIERVWQQTESLQKNNLLTKVRWMAKKSEVRGLKPDMESLKSSLHLVMASITMEALEQSGSDDLEEEMYESRLYVMLLLLISWQ